MVNPHPNTTRDPSRIPRRSFLKSMIEAGAISAAVSSPLFAQAEKLESGKVTIFETLFSKEKPVIPKRGVHLDLKGLPPTAERLVSLLKLFAAARYNVVLVEWEDSFPWTVDERFRSPTAYTPDEVRHFRETAVGLGLEIIPLVQCLGHMETPLSVPGYESLREVPDNSSGLNPLAPGARDLIQRMVDDVLKLLPDVRHFHLGGDEARTLGQHPDTQAYIKQHGKGALYLQHVGPILDNLNARKVRPILWHDMMIDWDSEALKALAGKSDLMTWGYNGNPDTTKGHFNTKYIQRFRDHGIVQWGATAYKGCEGDTWEKHTADRPVISEREENALAWAAIAQRLNLAGVVATGWSRWAVDTMQCVPIDGALDSLLNVAVILHDGQPPVGGITACIDALAALDEKKRFEACKAAMEHLTDVRHRGWQMVQFTRQQMTLAKIDPHRTSARSQRMGLKVIGNLKSIVKESDRVAEDVRRCFVGLVARIWIDEYLATRLTPLHDELSSLVTEADTMK